MIDRPIRPLFPKYYNFETQVIATVLAMDQENDADVMAMVGASAALTLSDIPFAGPIACVRVGRIQGELKINPTIAECAEADINIIVAGSKTGVVMVEGGGNIVSEKEMLEAIFFGHQGLQPLIEIQVKLREACGKPKRIFTPPETDEALVAVVREAAAENIREALVIPDKMPRYDALRQVKLRSHDIIGR